MIEIWGRKNAYNVQKVLWTLHELELEYVHHDIGSITGDLETDDFLTSDRNGQVILKQCILLHLAFACPLNDKPRF